ncbi:electron transport complex subunit RsxC [Shewanella algae]|uniref:electron transport complex subunit RsxC n=2 Tax=Shewanella algae TaxID=38313 RepID=UPI0011832B6A|nr:electron transport complex subunit RsxC [Shewanella algae]QXP28532.1 electron transport complex subunit RsxC [Shewanella algae]QXP34461.1 electron transport complex subunit RsxC [Shewanella algae]QXP37720.1 electron transport complex subunit RsxC [Shewanella algae]UYA14786.1 electron transport complex subunit RsxC [Shewanella algae]
MLTLLEQLDKGTQWRLTGGIHPPQMKDLSNGSPIGRLPLASEFLLPVPQVGDSAVLEVKVGDRVLKGQALTRGLSAMYLAVHAPTSGIIRAIEQRPSNHPSALPVLTCVLEADGQDQAIDFDQQDIAALSREQILSRIRQAGIAGLGGAMFPAHIKLNPASEIELLLINGVECEPYISADDRLMREHAREILDGIEIVHGLLNPKRVIIAIEDNKPEAVQAMQQALDSCHLPKGSIRITVIPTKYPSGGEKQLIQIITGQEVPSGAIPAQLGIVVHNVGTAFAIREAVCLGKPLIERVVTVTGGNIPKPGNYWVPLGTPIAHILEQSGFTPSGQDTVIIGGPMMGHTLPLIKVPLLKGSNCILVPSASEISPPAEEKACIRCGECAQVCPASLLPQQLYWHSKAEEYDKASAYNLRDCIECGCCSYVCPSDIPLVEYYRVAKAAIKRNHEEKQLAEQAKQRFDARLKRLEAEKQAREAKAKAAADKRRAAMGSGEKDAVAEAMARIKAKKAAEASVVTTESPVEKAVETDSAVIQPKADKRKSDVAAAIARAKAKKAAAQGTVPAEEVADATTDNAAEGTTPSSDKKAQVAAAIARAKAKKAAAASGQTETGTCETQDAQASSTQATASEASQTVSDDSKQARIAAAVARAKAKKAAAASESTPATDVDGGSAQGAEVNQVASQAAKQATSDDSKQARIAAAVAKAKAKKAATASESTPATDFDGGSAQAAEVNQVASQAAKQATSDDSKQARIAAAVAKAKAKKAAAASESAKSIAADDNGGEQAQAAEVNQVASQAAKQVTSDDSKQARIAAAVAKAKAKKAAAASEQPQDKGAANTPVSAESRHPRESITAAEPSSADNTPSDDSKQARIARAVAKAKQKAKEKALSAQEKD